MSRSLIEISNDISTEQINLEMATNPEDFEIQLQELFNELYAKEDGIYWFYKSNEKRIEMLDEHIAKCTHIKKTLKYGSERMKQLVIGCHEDAGTMPKNSEFNLIKIRESAGAVDVIDETKIPNEYWITVETTKLDKKQILKDLKEGIPVPGTRLAKNKFVSGLK
ncbi:MAG: siphovirus Gp157 family protein [Pelagibacterales bacterium]|nr:siphovirus Gp157 family protein [Pelagibacterales bacterium]